ncbi:hypothetical protein DXG01_001806, partial [Tephrocybe rancida]
FLKTQSLKLTKTPGFRTNRHGHNKAAADVLKKDVEIIGASGGFTVLAAHDSKIDTTGWKPGSEWSAVFAQYAQPEHKKTFLVCGLMIGPVLNVWSDSKEWSSLQMNAAVKEVETCT